MDAGFDTRWKLHPRPQATTPDVLWQKTGWSPQDLAGRRVLDAGCGCGRFAMVARDAGATVTGIDAAPHAIAAAQENCPEGSFAQVDLLDAGAMADLGDFDLAYSMGVLHHTADPERAFANVARCVRPGGQLAVWVYARPGTDYPVVMEMFHEITRACPTDRLHEIFARYACRVRDEYAGTWGPLQSVLQVSGSTDDDECVSDTFDWHCPQYRSWHTVNEVCNWFTNCGFAVDWIGSFPVSVRGTKAP